MNIAFITDHDYSNLAYLYAESVKYVGHRSASFCTEKPSYGQNPHADKVEHSEIKSLIRGFDIAVIMHSAGRMVSQIPDGMPYFVMHGGTRYRQHNQEVHRHFRKSRGAIIQTPDLLGLVDQNESLICAPVGDFDIPLIRIPQCRNHFGHYPTNRMNKGSEQIRRAAEQAGVVVDYSDMILSREANLQRISRCKIYVELFKPTQRGKLYGTFGVTALEAALVGRPVITMCANYDKYLERYDNDEFEIVRTEAELVESLRECSELSDAAIEAWGLRCREKVEAAHHPARIGEQLMTFIIDSL